MDQPEQGPETGAGFTARWPDRAGDGGADSRTIVEAGDTGLKGRVKLSLRHCESLAHGAVRLTYAVTPDDGA